MMTYRDLEYLLKLLKFYKEQLEDLGVETLDVDIVINYVTITLGLTPRNEG